MADVPGSIDHGSGVRQFAVPAHPSTVQVSASCRVGERYPEPGEEVRIDASGSEEADAYRFDRNGEGNYDTDWLPDSFHYFTYDAGQYTPRVAVRNDSQEAGNVDVVRCPTIEVGPNEAPTANATHSPASPSPGEQVTIDARDSSDADGEVTTYQFDFGADGSYEVQENVTGRVTRTYDSPGTRQVRVRVIDDDGATDTTLVQFTVGEQPVARCSVSAREVAPGEDVTLFAGESQNADDYQYDADQVGGYGDFTANDTATVSYAEAGEYTPRVRVWAYPSETSDETDCPSVTVSANDPPTADFTVSPRPAVAGERTTLDASASTDSDGTIDTYRWDFDGDGTVDRNTTRAVTDYRFSYRETGEGFATVVLTVVDDDGATDVAETTVDVVRRDLTATCTVSPTAVAPGDEVQLAVDPGPGVDQFQYDRDSSGAFGDFTRETTWTVSYDEPGTYTPRVRIWNSSSERSRVIECDPVTVGEGNEPPTASFTVSPTPVVANERATLDASASSDPDGVIEFYRWDLDDDGSIERNTTRPVIDTRFPYDTTAPGLAQVTLRVVDDDGAIGLTDRDVDIVQGELTAACTLSPATVAPGESVTLTVDPGPRADQFQYDRDSSGSFGDFTTETTATVTYDEPGTYTPRVRAWNRSSEQSIVVSCGNVTVTVPDELGNQPPNAVLTYRPSSPAAGTTVTLEAANSSDPDGRLVEYRWDLDGDGTPDQVTAGPSVRLDVDGEGRYDVGVVVVDDDGATDRATGVVPVRVPSTCGVPVDLAVPAWLPCWSFVPILFGGGVGGGLLACRGISRYRRIPKPSAAAGKTETPSGVVGYATGTVETPTRSETVPITGLGFEPDLLLFTATNAVAGGGRHGGPGRHRTDGWNYGAAKREADGSLEQQVVGVANDFQRTDAAVGTARAGRVLDLVVHENDRADAIAGAVERTTEDGFDVAFDTSALPAGEADDSYSILYQAFAFESPDDVAVGHFVTPDTPGTQTVDLGVDANHVVLTATNVVDGLDTAQVTGDAVGVSHGSVVGGSTPVQTVMNSTVDPTRANQNAYAAYDDRALSLLHAEDGEVRGQTSARVTGLGERLELTYDEVAAPAGQSSGSVVTYVAMDAGEQTPAVGYFSVPGPESGGETTVDVGFAPSFVEFTGCHADAVGDVQTWSNNLLGFGWTYGTALVGADGRPVQQRLQSAVDADVLARRDLLADVDALPPVEDFDGTGDWEPNASTDGGRPEGPPDARSDSPGDDVSRVYGRQNVATLLAMDADGRITGWDDLGLTDVSPRGFRVGVDSLDSAFRDRATERRPVVFYKAWPAFDASTHRRMVPTEDAARADGRDEREEARR